jgi:hypothetical protein
VRIFSPLERFDIGQLRIVGIVWDIKEPRAIIEDSAGLGYTVKVGTPIGSNDGRVKVIRRDQIVVEEVYEDAYGVRKKTRCPHAALNGVATIRKRTNMLAATLEFRNDRNSECSFSDGFSSWASL